MRPLTDRNEYWQHSLELSDYDVARVELEGSNGRRGGQDGIVCQPKGARKLAYDRNSVVVTGTIEP